MRAEFGSKRHQDTAQTELEKRLRELSEAEESAVSWKVQVTSAVARADHAEGLLRKQTELLDEMAEMAAEEIGGLEERLPQLEKELQLGLVPPDPTDSRDTIVEIRAGAGGDGSKYVGAGP